MSYGVFLHGYATSDERAIHDLAQLTGLSHIDAKLILASRVPRQVFASDNREAAEDRLLTLRTSGFDGFAASFEALSRGTVPVARSARLGPEEADFEPGGLFRSGELRLILAGELRNRREISVSVRMPGPITGVRQSTKTESRDDSVPFLHLYGESHRRLIEVRANEFDFHCLGSERGLAAVPNLKKLVERLQTLFPNARYDATLETAAGVLDDIACAGLRDTTGQPLSRMQSNEAGLLRTSRLMAIMILRG